MDSGMRDPDAEVHEPIDNDGDTIPRVATPHSVFRASITILPS